MTPIAREVLKDATCESMMVGKIISARVIVPNWTGTKQKIIVSASMSARRVMFLIVESLLFCIFKSQTFVELIICSLSLFVKLKTMNV